MGDATLLRLLELVCREVGADDARVEIGGKDPTDERLIACPLGQSRRVVAVFVAPPADPGAVRSRLEALVSPLADLTAASPSEPAPHDSPVVASRRLDDELYALAVRTSALSALVIDDTSPVIWGTSEPRRSAQQDVETALATARAAALAAQAGVDLEKLIEQDPRDILAALTQHSLDHESVAMLRGEVIRLQEVSRRRGHEAWRAHLLTARAIERVRDATRARPRVGHLHEVVREDGFGYLARSFATIYTLLLVFDGSFSELHVEGATLQALPGIERLVLALPPLHPPHRGAKVVRLPR